MKFGYLVQRVWERVDLPEPAGLSATWVALIGKKWIPAMPQVMITKRWLWEVSASWRASGSGYDILKFQGSI